MVSHSGKVMVSASFRFPYYCSDVQHNQWIIYISPGARSKANIKRKMYWEIVLSA